MANIHLPKWGRLSSCRTGTKIFHDLYFGVMLGYRRGDDISASVSAARTNTNAMDDTPRRRLLVLLSVFEAAGAIARELESQMIPMPNGYLGTPHCLRMLLALV